jgi:acetate kinase
LAVVQSCRSEANVVGQPLISHRDSRVALYAIPTDDELMIARQTLSALPQEAARALVSESETVARRRFAL